MLSESGLVPPAKSDWFVGLVIVEAKYGPKDDEGDATKGLVLDVTIPLQALVNNSQLYIPGGRSKVSSGPSAPFHFISGTSFISFGVYGSGKASLWTDNVPVSVAVASMAYIIVCQPLADFIRHAACCAVTG